MEPLLTGFLIMFVGITVIPPVARRVGIPVIVGEIIFGIVVGKSFLDAIPENEIVDFFSSFGLVYLMFLAGLEVDFGQVRRGFLKPLSIAGASLAVPFTAGAALGEVVDVHPLLLGTILSTTSLGLVLPIVRDMQSNERMAQFLLVSVTLVDIASMFLLAFSIGAVQGDLGVEFLYSFLLILVLFFLPWVVGRRVVKEKIVDRLSQEGYFETEVRLAFALVFLLTVVAEELGYHGIVGAFIAGLIVAEIFPAIAPPIEEKLESFGYGFFIPLFFIIVGSNVNLPSLFSSTGSLTALALIVTVGLLSKAVGVSAASWLLRFSVRESLAFGLFHMARLSLIIAAAEIALDLEMIGENIFSMLVLLALVSGLVGPTLGKLVLERGKAVETSTPVT
ncbi:MAG: cation:proton antiporter [Chloroflexota bacterium]